MKNVVLIVEDESIIRWHLSDHFREAGYAVLEAASGDHAMALCQDRTAVHVLVTDIELEGAVTGWDVAKAFRAIWSNIPVVYTSGKIFDAKQSVADSWFFVKPYDPFEIVGKCQQIMAAQNR